MDTRKRIREIFADALDMPSDRRGQFVQKECGDDGDMRAAVESLLNAHDRAGEFLADPVIDPASFNMADTVAAGTQIGPYKIIKRIGEGGYGAVYLAEQQPPFRRQVALKLIKPGMDSRLIIARFEAERQALALMEHSNIARVLDVGTTTSGHPYFVMEYVDGPSITSFCTAKGLSISERLGLFAKVCIAVQHAHQKGIIHRDLKPANILIAMQDGVAAPKIIDFGIAKALQIQLTEHTVLTGHGQFLGTPQYMSPEQAGSAPDIDTRTDIYALGAILYELLTGTPAFNLAELRAAAVDEFQRIIREVDPPKPSTRLLTATGTPPSSSSPDARTVRKTANLLRGELDWIVMKSMEKDRARRYETAESLANDIQRYLDDEPVAAGPPSRMYKLSKFVRRHRILIAAGAAVLISLVAGLTVASMALVHANYERELAVDAQRSEADARHQAEEQRAAAEANAVKAETQAKNLFAAQTFLYRLLAPNRDGSGELPPRELLDYAAQKITASSFSDHPEVQGPVHAALGNGYLQRGLFHEAEIQYRAAMECFRHTGDNDGPNLASAMNNTASTLIKQGKYSDAEPLLREALAMYRRMNHEDNVIDAPVLSNLATVLATQEHYEEAAQLLRSALVYFQRYYGDRSTVAANVMEQLADVLEYQGKHDEAIQYRRDAVAIRKSPSEK